ncbi:MAG: SpoIIE family protein phosphatase [Acetatifactor sp.]|nr:SpoIIE family protein phosphatase [Acetatifactor sp.]MDE6699531.1 SpoIIE family protein phosphatase [Acetatifactor sp.]
MIAAVKGAKEYLYGRREKESIQDHIRVPELCRQKLLHYAESFQELARCMETGGEEQTAWRGETFAEETSEDVRQPDRRDVLEERRSQENRLLISHNLCEVAQIMIRLADELFRCRPMEERYRKLLLHALRTESIYADHFCYLTEKADDTHAISMTLSTNRKGGCPAAQVADMLSVLLKRPLQLSAASPYLVEQEPHSFVFMEEAKYMALTGFCKVTKENETISGDHYAILESEKGKMTLLLSDGTGSGERASKDSEKVLDLMEKLLEAGYDTEAAVNMVNVAFFAGGRECNYPTLDICDLNLYDGSCSFCKIGGAASFLKRGDRVEQISQCSFPLGIFRNVETNRIDRQLQDGDYVILMTDGVLDALGEGNYEEAMERAVAELSEVSPGEIAERLLELALCACGGHIRDDMTVLVAGIWENAVAAQSKIL